MKPTTLLAALASISTVSGWKITWYSGENCHGDSYYDTTTYSGSGAAADGMDNCLLPGEPGHVPDDNCVWETHNGASGPLPCTNTDPPGTTPRPLSFIIEEGTTCRIGKNPVYNCSWNNWVPGRYTGKCTSVKEWIFNWEEDKPMYFQCKNA